MSTATGPVPAFASDVQARVLAAAERTREGRPASPLADAQAQRQVAQQIDTIADGCRAHLARFEEHLPRRYEHATTDDPEIQRWADDVVKGGTEGLVLVGDTGRGKTHQAYGALRRIAVGMTEDYRRPLLVDWSVPDLLDVLRGFDNIPGKTSDAVMRECIAADVLLLDDLGILADTDRVETLVYRIINARWRDMKPLLVTTDLDGNEWQAKLGSRITSRLAGMVKYHPVGGPDRRRNVA